MKFLLKLKDKKLRRYLRGQARHHGKGYEDILRRHIQARELPSLPKLCGKCHSSRIKLKGLFKKRFKCIDCGEVFNENT